MIDYFMYLAMNKSESKSLWPSLLYGESRPNPCESFINLKLQVFLRLNIMRLFYKKQFGT